MRHSTVSLVFLVLLSACSDDPVTWVDRAEMPDRHPSPLAFPGPLPTDSLLGDSTRAAEFARVQDLLREAGAVSMLSSVVATMPESKQSLAASAPMAPMAPMTTAVAGTDLGQEDAPRDAARCARTLRVVDAPGRGRVAVWWSRRSGGRVALVAAWQMQRGPRDTTRATGDSTRPWRGPFNIDTLDQGAGDANAGERGAVGCDRPAPGVAVDERNGYVHVAYAMNAPEGAGVFYAHQMDPRSAFEQPIVILYGDRRLGTARVSAAGDLVAVAYEDPNAPLDHARVGLAVSRTAGHAFEQRTDASRSGKAVDPYVLVRGRAAVVGWTDADSSVGASVAFRLRRATLR